MSLTPTKTYRILHDSIGCLYRLDGELLNHGKIYERSIVFRLAHYLANMLSYDNNIDNGIYVDCEYMNHIDDIKSCYSGCINCQEASNIQCRISAILDRGILELPETIRPDIIVHKRRDTSQNLMVIEVKTPEYKRLEYLPEEPDVKDAAKLTYLTCLYSKVKYHYQIGIALRVMKDRARLWIFRGGKQIERKDI